MKDLAIKVIPCFLFADHQHFLSLSGVADVSFPFLRFLTIGRGVGQESPATRPQEQHGLDRRRQSQGQRQPPQQEQQQQQPAPGLRLSRSAPSLTRRPSRLQAFVAGLVVDVEVRVCTTCTAVRTFFLRVRPF